MDVDAAFHAYHHSLFRYVARLSGDPELAEDVVQETFVQFAERRGADRNSVPTWLFRTGTRIARDALRKRSRRLTLLRARADKVPKASEGPRPEQLLEQQELRTAVRRALNELTERERTILLMRQEGFKHREIAEAVGTTTGSVGTLYARALKKLSNMLDGRLEAIR